MSDLFWLEALYAGIGLLLVVVSIPLVQRRIPKNIFYGFRVPKAYQSDEIWYEINVYSGKRLIVGGLVTALLALILPLLVQDSGVYVIAMTIVITVVLGIGLLQSFLYLNQIAE